VRNFQARKQGLQKRVTLKIGGNKKTSEKAVLLKETKKKDGI
jgi:hypothetical protein